MDIIKVGVLVDPPFCYEQDGKFVGICIDLWDKIAKINNYKFEYKKIGKKHKKKIINFIVDKELDIIIGYNTINYSDYNKIEYTTPFYLSKQSILYSKNIDVHEFIKKFIKILTIFVTLFIIFAIIFLKKENKSGKLNKKIINVFWRLSIAFLQGEVDETPKTLVGKIIILLIMICGIVIFTYFTIDFLNTLIGKQLIKVNTLSDIGQKNIIAEENTNAVEIISRYGGIVKIIDGNFEQALDYYSNNKSKYFGVMGDILQINYYLKKYPKKYPFEYSTINMDYGNISFIVRKGYDKLNDINKTILFLDRELITKNICQKYCGIKLSMLCT